MEQDLKVYLDNLAKTLATKEDLKQIRSEMATKKDLDQLRSETKSDMVQIRSEMATKSDLHKVEKNLIGYIEHIDRELQAHRHSSELHHQAAV